MWKGLQCNQLIFFCTPKKKFRNKIMEKLDFVCLRGENFEKELHVGKFKIL